ncbi:MAG: hypothetical protein HKN34_06635 [Gammaproteobacteria bacterium]|nr:hypothetical protein [Gammaproteobacteria bacterium]
MPNKPISKRLLTEQRLIIYLCVFFSFQLAGFSAKAETLPVSVSILVSDNFPRLIRRATRALKKTGLDIKVNTYPHKRSLAMLSRGEVALEIARIPYAVSQFTDLVRLQPSVQSLNYQMITSSKTPEMCEVNEEDYESMSAVGILGSDPHETYYSSKFRYFTIIGDAPALVKFVVLRRAEVSFLPEIVLNALPEEKMRGLKVCKTNSTEFEAYLHLHKNYIWAKDAVETELKAEFNK